MSLRVALITLGCDKNTVDSERYLAQLVGHGAEPTEDLAEAQVILVNTCGFIDAAKKESLDAILGAAQLKQEGACRAVVAVGCMVQRHKAELQAELPEVDLFLGSSEVDRLIPELAGRGLLDAETLVHPGERTYAGELPHVRYLKISEGCDHGCAFCAIPLMRGRHRSFGLADVVREAQLLEMQGAREINLVAQDLAHWGRDRRDGFALPELLRALLDETSAPWYRLLYIYSAGLTPALLELIGRESRIVPYLDMPIQHGADEVLKRMRRPERSRTIRETVARVRGVVPGIALRTTCIVGFPGETEEDFERLLDLLEEVRFERVGAFTYSPQDGTRAFALPDDVPAPVKRERLERLTELQRAITAERYEAHIGRTIRAIVDHPADEEGICTARTVWQANDIDGVTRLLGDAPAGAIVDAAIEDVVDDYDFRATLVRVVDVPPAVAPRPRRTLPIAGSSIGSFGR